jgi:hypothetical protein
MSADIKQPERKSMKVNIKNRNTDAVLFECDVPDSDKSSMAVRYALEAAILTGVDLTGADLTYADLRGAVLRGADLRGADLTDADLRGADLTDTDLTYADLRGADLTDADLTDAVLAGADLTNADLTDAYAKQIPCATAEQAIENLDKVREILLDNRTRLDMSDWHSGDDWHNKTCAEETLCGTTHCLAGWLQVCSTHPEIRAIDAQLAGLLCAPVAAKMFFKGNDEVLDWLEKREYAKQSESAA